MELLNDMALFVEVVKAKGFRAAADVLDMPSSTLSRRISALEKAIGLRLLHRTTRKIELTEAGRIYFERCKRIVGDARLAQQMAAQLLDDGIYVTGFSFPVVPKGKARIRTQMSAAHASQDIQRAIEAFTKVGKALGVV